MARNKGPESWSLKEGFSVFAPWTNEYKTMRGRNARTGVRFILPFIIGFLVFMLIPLIQSLQFSLNDVTLVPGKGYSMVWNKFNNYVYAFTIDASFNKSLLDESGKMVINTIATPVLSFVLAVILNQKFKGRTLVRAIFFLPVILSSGVLAGIEQTRENYNMMASIAEEAANSTGVNLSASLQNLLSVSGVGGGVFQVVFDMIDAIYDIVMASGIQIIVFLTGLAAISPSLYEAADVEGCTAWEAFWKITFPIMSPLLLVNTIYTIIDFFMKNNNSVMEHINSLQLNSQYGQAAAQSWIYFIVALAFIGISSLIISKGVSSSEN